MQRCLLPAVSRPGGWQQMAAMRRRSATAWKGEDDVHQQPDLFQGYQNVVLAHAGLRQALLVSKPTNGAGSATGVAAVYASDGGGITDHVWTLRRRAAIACPRGGNLRPYQE